MEVPQQGPTAEPRWGYGGEAHRSQRHQGKFTTHIKRKRQYKELSRSFKVIDVGTPGKVVSSACYEKQKSMSICNRSDARVNSGKITISYGVPSLMLSFERNLLTQWHEIWSQQTRDSTLSYGENLESLSHLGLNRYRDVTNGHNYDSQYVLSCIVISNPTAHQP